MTDFPTLSYTSTCEIPIPFHVPEASLFQALGGQNFMLAHISIYG